MAIIRTGSQKEYLQAGGGVGVARPIAPINSGVMPVGEGALAGVARTAIEGAGKILIPVAQGYREAQTEKVDNELLRVEQEFTRFREDWKEKHQGVAGANADKVFLAKHAELSKEAMERLEPEQDEIFKGLMEQRLKHQSVAIEKEGLAYSRQQRELFRQSQWEGQLASFERLAEENLGDSELLAREEANLVSSWQLKNPGRDATAIKMKLREVGFDRRLQTLIAQRKLSEAQELLALYKGGASHGAERNSGGAAGASYSGRGKTEGRGHTIAEDLCNPLNLKKVGHNGGARADYENFATDKDGFLGALRQLKIYQSRYKLMTPREMISRWAPASDGNNLKKYYEAVEKAGGIDIDKAIDMNDPAQAARLIRGMAFMESPLGAKYSVAEVQAMLEEGGEIKKAGSHDGPENSGQAAASQQPVGVNPQPVRASQQQGLPDESGVSPLKLARYQLELDNLMRQEQSEAGRKMSQGLDDYFAKCKAGVIVEPPFRPDEIAAAFGESAAAINEKIEREGQFAITLNELNHLPLREQEAKYNELRPGPLDDNFKDKLDTWQRLGQAIAQNQKAREADPAAYINELAPEVGAAARAFIKNPTPENFDAYFKRLSWESRALEMSEAIGDNFFPKAMAAQVADSIQEAGNSGAYLKAIQEATGEYYPKVIKQLAPSLGVNALIYASGMPDKAVKKILEARLDPKFNQNAEAQLRLAGPDKASFDEELMDITASISETFQAAGNTTLPQALRENIRTLAYQYSLTLGLSTSEALSRAADEVCLSRYHIQKSPSGMKYRIPKDAPINPDSIDKALKKYVRSLNMDDISLQINPSVPEKYQRNAYRRMLEYNSTIITNEDESGIYLFNNGQPLRNLDGSPKSISWQELANASK